MASVLEKLERAVIAGFVLAAILFWLLVRPAAFDHGYWTFFMRWLHVLSGVMWIGLLWYFNFVQTPSMPKIPDEQKPAVTKVIAPTALFARGVRDRTVARRRAAYVSCPLGNTMRPMFTCDLTAMRKATALSPSVGSYRYVPDVHAL